MYQTVFAVEIYYICLSVFECLFCSPVNINNSMCIYKWRGLHRRLATGCIDQQSYVCAKKLLSFNNKCLFISKVTLSF